MTPQVESPTRTFPNNAALTQYIRVSLSGSNLAAAAEYDREIGTLAVPTVAADESAAVYLRTAQGTQTFVASGAITQYVRVYGAASGKVSSTANGNYIGLAMTSTSNADEQVEVLRHEDTSALLYSSVAASANITNTSAETAFDISYTIPANTLKAGDVLQIRAFGLAPTTNSTDTLIIKVKIGTSILVTSATVDVADADMFVADCTLSVRTAGASGTTVASGLIVLGVPITATTRGGSLASATLDTTATQAITVTATWSVASTSNIVRLDQLAVQRLAR